MIYPNANYNQGFNGSMSNNNNLNWVQGENSARAWLVAPSSTVLLMDSEGSRFYIKSADSSGMPTLRTFEYKEITNNIPQETKKYMMDSTGEYSHDYSNSERSKKAISSDPLLDEYKEAKKNYRYSHTMDCKRELLDKLDKYMDEFTNDMNEMMKDAECQEERTTIQRYLNKIKDFR